MVTDGQRLLALSTSGQYWQYIDDTSIFNLLTYDISTEHGSVATSESGVESPALTLYSQTDILLLKDILVWRDNESSTIQ